MSSVLPVVLFPFLLPPPGLDEGSTPLLPSAPEDETPRPEQVDDDPPARRETWPQWRGPSRDGLRQGTQWPEALDSERLELRWRAKLDKGYSSPVVTAERVFTVETVEERDELVRAFDRETGEELWTRSWEGSLKVPFFAARNGSWVRSTPAHDVDEKGARLYVGGMRDVLACLDAEGGELLWVVDFVDREGTPVPSFGFVCSPLVSGDHVYVQAGGGFQKLDKYTGETVWTTMTGGEGMDSPFSSPVLAEIGGKEQLLVQSRTHLAGIEPDSGDELWKIQVKAFRGMNILTPTVVGDAVFTACYGGKSHLYEVTSGELGFSVESIWDARPRGYMSSPVVIDEHVYLFSQSNRLSCLRLADGEVRWISEPLGDDYWSIIAQGKRLLALTEDGELVLVDADPEQYRELGRVEVVDGETWAHLAVCDNQIFVRDLEGLSVYDWK